MVAAVLLRALLVLILAGVALPSPPAPAAAQTDLQPLGDEFENAGSLGSWRRIHVEEQWNADQLEVWDIDGSTPGAMTMIPYTVVWYGDWRGPYAYKTVGGDFVATTSVTSTGRDGVSVPASLYSLGGVLIRTPRGVTPGTWAPGGENYVFLSLGHGNAQPPEFQFEVKTTIASSSQLFLTPAPGPTARLQIARLGPYVITLRSAPGQPWVVHRRFPRADFGDSLQVGLVTYTDWGKCQHFAPFDHNSNALDPPLPGGLVDPRPDLPFNPDLRASFDYLRFHRPTVPPALAGLDLSDPGQVGDAELLAFLGENANEPAPLGVGEGPAEARLALSFAPSPFREAVTVRFRVPRAGRAKVTVHDLAGRRVRELASGTLAAGIHAVTWEGRDDAGKSVPPGIYLVRFSIGESALTRRIARLR